MFLTRFSKYLRLFSNLTDIEQYRYKGYKDVRYEALHPYALSSRVLWKESNFV